MLDKNDFAYSIKIKKLTRYLVADTGYTPMTVHRIIANLRKGKGIKRKAPSPRSDQIRTRRFIGGLKRSITQIHHSQWQR